MLDARKDGEEEEPGPQVAGAEETEEQRARASCRADEEQVRAELVRSLREKAAEQREQLNVLRAGGKDKLPTDPAKLAKFRELMPLYQETRARLQRLDA